MSWLGLDIGGANLKVANGRGWARCVPFALWRDPGGLANALATLIDKAPNAERLAVTMTGELCDCFRTKADGVQHILAAVERVAGARNVGVYSLAGRLISIDDAREHPHEVAAANWHALAAFACRYLPGRTGILIDVGSTTTDIVPLAYGRPAPRGWNDTDRLLSGELVYTGVGRTPVCAVTHTLPWRGHECPVAAELFATTADAYVLLGELPEEPHAEWTADSQPLTADFARHRLARMICADATQFESDDALRVALRVRERQQQCLAQAVERVAANLDHAPEGFIVSGQGEFLTTSVVAGRSECVLVISLTATLGRELSRNAPAHALAVLANQSVAY